MDLECAHVVLNSSNVVAAKDFYVQSLGFPLVEEHPQSFAFRAGAVRYTVTPGGKVLGEADPSNATMIFRTKNVEETVQVLRKKGITFSSEIMEASGFMKFISLCDPDNNPVMLGQYLRDPLASG